MASRGEWEMSLELAKRGPSLGILQWTSPTMPASSDAGGVQVGTGPCPSPDPSLVRAKVYHPGRDADQDLPGWWTWFCRVPGCSYGAPGVCAPENSLTSARDDAVAHLRGHGLRDRVAA